MVYTNTDRAVWSAADRYIAEDLDSSVVAAVCGICGCDIYQGEDYYSNGDMDMCCSCHEDFTKIWD